MSWTREFLTITSNFDCELKPINCLLGTLTLKPDRTSLSFYPLLRVWTCELSGEMRRGIWWCNSENVTRSEHVSFQWNTKMYLMMFSTTEIRTWVAYFNSLTNFSTWNDKTLLSWEKCKCRTNIISVKQSTNNLRQLPRPATRKDMSCIWHGIREEGRWKRGTRPTKA
jgi:hypothetical protein